VALWQVISAGVRVSGAPTHPGRRLSGTQAPLRMNCRAAAAARHLAPPPVPHHTGRPGIRLMARPAFPAHCRRCAAVQVDGTDGQAPRHAGPIVRAGPDVIREPPHERNGLGRLLGKIEEAPAAGQQPCQHGQDRPIGPGQPRCPYLPLEQGHLVRRIKISASLAPPDPASKTSQPNTRSSARLANRIDASTDSADPGDSAQPNIPHDHSGPAQVTRSTALKGISAPTGPGSGIARRHRSGRPGGQAGRRVGDDSGPRRGATRAVQAARRPAGRTCDKQGGVPWPMTRS